MKSYSLNSGCTSSVSSKCVTWNGPTIPCLSICNGDSVTDVVHTIATKVCALSTSLDLNTLDLTCLIGLCESCPQDKSLRTILQLILDNQCSLQTLIEQIDTSGSGTVSLNLNLGCLKKFDAFNNEIPQDLNQVLQSLINEVCIHKTKIATLEGTVLDLQDQIDNLPPPDTYVEPSVTICTTGTPKKLSVAIPLVAQDLCDYKETVGSLEDVQNALSRQCENLNTLLGSTVGWDNTPTTLAQSVNNIWITVCNILNRVKAIEQTCCAPSCDKIKLGFVATVADDNTVDLLFSGGAGTFIPSGFVDCGSIITLTDKNGVSFTPNITGTPISQDGIVEGVNISSLATGLINVNIKTKFCLLDSGGKVIMTCQDCVNLSFMNTNGCCVITNVGDTTQTIIYKTTITTA